MSQELEPWNDPKIEALVVASILGEVSDFEQEELETLYHEHPELDLFRKRIAGIHETLSELHKEEKNSWILPQEKRDLLLETFHTAKGTHPEITTLKKKHPRLPLKSLSLIAACLTFGLLTIGFFTFGSKTAKDYTVTQTPELIASYSTPHHLARQADKANFQDISAELLPPPVFRSFEGEEFPIKEDRPKSRPRVSKVITSAPASSLSTPDPIDDSFRKSYKFGREEDLTLGRTDGISLISSNNTSTEIRVATPINIGRIITTEQIKPKTKPSKKEQKKKTQQLKKSQLEGEETSTLKEAFSTFSLNVSDVSFKLAAAALAKGSLPSEVRVEDFVNAFDYGDSQPTMQEKISCRIEQAIHPFLQQRNLVRISMKTAAAGRNSATPLNLTILLDRSGSMQRGDRKACVSEALKLLLRQLTPQDEVTVITFARGNRLVLDREKGITLQKTQDLLEQLNHLPSEGGTNLEQVLNLGFSKALASQTSRPNSSTRVILMTDGAANLGDATPESLSQIVENMRNQKISFDACGVGAQGLNDTILENLTRKGDGRYYLLDRPEDADAGFSQQIAGALRPAAKNVKVQVEWNPDRIDNYLLYGFKKHRLNKEDFRNDTIDAAELAAAEQGNALYHVQVKPDGIGDLGSVSVRFQDVATGQMIEKQWSIPYSPTVKAVEKVSPSMRTAAVAGLFGELLSESPTGQQVELKKLENFTQLLHKDSPEFSTLQSMMSQLRALK